MIPGGRGVADRPPYIRAVYDNPAPLSDDGSAARGIAVGMALSFPIWCGLAALAWWAWVVTGSCGK